MNIFFHNNTEFFKKKITGEADVKPTPDPVDQELDALMDEVDDDFDDDVFDEIMEAPQNRDPITGLVPASFNTVFHGAIVFRFPSIFYDASR